MEIVINLDTRGEYPKTLTIRNSPDGMIWQLYHVRNGQEAFGLTQGAIENGFYGIALEHYQPEYEETFLGWRLDSSEKIVGKNFVPTKQDMEDFERRKTIETEDSDYWAQLKESYRFED